MLTTPTRIFLFAASLTLANSAAQPVSLPFMPTAIHYSKALDKFVGVASYIGAVHIVNPLTGTETFINLNSMPLSLSLSPDGTHAAVGHDGAISYVNLVAGTVEKVIPVSLKVSTLILSGNGNVWIPPVTSVNISSGEKTTALSGPPEVVKPARHPNGNWIYFTQGSIPARINKGDMVSGIFELSSHWLYSMEFNVCEGLYFSADGKRLLSGCGALLRTTAGDDDMKYAGSLAAMPYVLAAADSAVSHKFGVIPRSLPNTPNADTEVHFYDSEYLRSLGRISLPNRTVEYPWHGRDLFYNSDGTKLHVLLSSDSDATLASIFAIYTIRLADVWNCGASLSSSSANVPAAGAKLNVNLIAASGCLSEAASNSTWLNLDTGGVSNGNSTLTIRALPNLLTAPRTGTVTVSGLTFTVTQDAAPVPGANSVIASPVRPAAADYSPALDRMILVSSGPDLLTILDPVSGAQQAVPLVLPPTSVSISADGLRAAVGHDAWITYVNLSTAKVESMLRVTAPVSSLAFGSRDTYVFPAGISSASLRVVNNTSGAEALGALVSANTTGGKISANGKYLYINAINRLDTTQPPPPALDHGSGDSPLQWFSQDGSRLFSGSGLSYRVSDDRAQDLQRLKLVQQGGIVAAADSSVQQLLAIVPRSSTGYGRTMDDTVIKLLSQPYLNQVGTLTLPKFTDSIYGRGRHLFWNAAGNRLFAVLQADENSGLLNEFSILRVSMNAACGVTLDHTTANAPASGANLTLGVTAPAGCGWKAVSSASWLNVAANTSSAGPATISLLVDRNFTTSARTATITVDGQTLTVSQAAGADGPVPMVNSLPFRVTDAEYSLALDRIVAITSDPNRLVLYDGATGKYQQVDLPMPGIAVSVGPNGLRAAVCHDGLITLVNLQSAAVEKSVPMKLGCFDVALADNGFVHWTFVSGLAEARSLDLTTGAEKQAGRSGLMGAYLQIKPDGDSIYTSHTLSSSASVDKYRISAGWMDPEYGSGGYPDPAVGYKVWFTRDGRMMGDSANIFRSGSSRATDFVYDGTLSGYLVHNGIVASISHSPASRLFASIGRGNNSFDLNSTEPILQLHGDKSYALASKVELPKTTVGATQFSNFGKFVFWNRAGSKVFVITQTDPAAGLLSDFSIYTLSPEFTPGCPVSLGIGSGTASAAGQSGGVAVNAAAGCVWEAKSNASWVQIDSGTLGVGIGNLAYSVLPNYTTTSRSAVLTIGGQTYTITQEPGINPSCAFSPLQRTLTASSAGGSLLLKVNASAPGCVWSIQSDSDWATPAKVGVQSGTASMRITVDANKEYLLRAATLDIAGEPVVIVQESVGCSFDVSASAQTIPAEGATSTFTVAGIPGCGWTHAASPAWISVALAPSGNHQYTVEPNPGATARVGSLIVSDKAFPLIQLGRNPAAVFQDVPVAHPFFPHIGVLKDSGVTKGCTATNFCPDQSTTRGQMAAFLVRAILGDTFDYSPRPYFTDVPETHPFFNYIQKLRELGVTAGCTLTEYCPDTTVTRGQMAAFLIRARLGIKAGDTFHYTATPYFLDAPDSHPFFSYIQKMKDLGITNGVTATTYGPEDPNTRGQMAVFLIRGLLTP
jgi:hypothetical protein